MSNTKIKTIIDKQWIAKKTTAWVSSFLMAHQHIIGCSGNTKILVTYHYMEMKQGRHRMACEN